MGRLTALLREVNAEFKDQSSGPVVQSLGDVAAKMGSFISGLSSGSVELNFALSGNPLVGYGWGRVVEIFGPEQSGKTTLTLHALYEAQKLGLPTAFIDAEHALDPRYAQSIGVDLDDLVIHQPDYGEQAIEVTRALLRHGVKVIVIDSVAALTPRSEIEGETGDAHMGRQARMMGQAMRQLVAVVSRQNALVIFINQLRMKLGMVFGNPEETTGGKALKFYASYRLDVRSPRGGAIKSKSSLEGGGETVETGIATKIKIVKNKLYPPFRQAVVYIEYGTGIDRYRDVAEYLVKRSGSTRTRIGGKAYTGKQLATALRESKKVRQAALQLLRQSEDEEDQNEQVED